MRSACCQRARDLPAPTLPACALARRIARPLPGRAFFIGRCARCSPLVIRRRGNTSITVHGTALGGVRYIRYVRHGEWLEADSAGLALAALPMCHPGCPQSVGEVTYLEEASRRLSAEPEPEPGATSCDNRPPSVLAAHAALNESRWYRIAGAAGSRLHTSAPQGRRCGAEAAGWLVDDHPQPGEPPRRSPVCFAYSWSECLWTVDVLSCACSYDGGQSTIYSYRLPTPPGEPTCSSYCSANDTDPVAADAAADDSTGGRRLQYEREYEAYEVAARTAAAGAAAGATAGPGAPAFADADAAAAAFVTTHPELVSEYDAWFQQPGYDGVGSMAASAAGDASSSPSPPPSLRRTDIVGYMPGDPRDVGAHLDISSESRLFGRTPPLDAAQWLEVQISENGSQWFSGAVEIGETRTHLPIGFTFFDEPRLSRLWPAAGPISGGTNVTLTGSGFMVLEGVDLVRCRFGEVEAVSYLANDTHVLCTTPRVRGDARFPPGPARFAVTVNGQDFHTTPSATDAAGAYLFYSASLTAIRPTCGALRGGSFVTIMGTGLDALGGLALDPAGRPYEPRCRFTAPPAAPSAAESLAMPAAVENATAAAGNGSGVSGLLTAANGTPAWQRPLPLFAVNGTRAVVRVPGVDVAGRTIVQVATRRPSGTPPAWARAHIAPPLAAPLAMPWLSPSTSPPLATPPPPMPLPTDGMCVRTTRGSVR